MIWRTPGQWAVEEGLVKPVLWTVVFEIGPDQLVQAAPNISHPLGLIPSDFKD